ncbi:MULTISPECIES: transposase [unclassified Streptomyces]|uniref:IS701 family transposase n=1 Tax=unclassified Streptomyces TaxID=2593676 RepID=UPI0027843E67|nr:transposase [Streptomyces sp. B4I13]MDQ0958595.1 SRSO17 transposase [Streptomyces sp. B4I13]
MTTRADSETAELRLLQLHARMAHRFHRAEPRRRSLAYVQGLLSEAHRKNGLAIAHRSGARSPDGMHRLLRSANWDVDGVRDDIREFVVERLRPHSADGAGVVLVGEVEFLKSGRYSVGVAREFVPRLQRSENCQIGVFCAYLTERGCGLIDRALYVPPSWADDPQRCATANVPQGTVSVERPELARRMIARALDAGLPASLVVSLDPYGRHAGLRAWLDERNISYALGETWARAASSDTATGIVPVRVPRRAPPRASSDPAGERLPEHWLLSDSAGPAARLVCSMRQGAGAAEVARALNADLAFRRLLRAAQEFAGLNQYQGRMWHGWYRHITLSMLASACLLLP